MFVSCTSHLGRAGGTEMEKDAKDNVLSCKLVRGGRVVMAWNCSSIGDPAACIASTRACRRKPALQSFQTPDHCLSVFFSPPSFRVCCTRGGKDRIYHLSAFGSPELRDAGQHKIIIHRHEITKPPRDPTTKLFHFFPPKKMEGVCLWGEEVTGEKWGWQTV